MELLCAAPKGSGSWLPGRLATVDRAHGAVEVARESAQRDLLIARPSGLSLSHLRFSSWESQIVGTIDALGCMNNISSRAWQRLLSQLEPKFQPSQVVSMSGFDPVQPHTQSFPFSPLNIQPVSLNPHVLKRELL